VRARRAGRGSSRTPTRLLHRCVASCLRAQSPLKAILPLYYEAASLSLHLDFALEMFASMLLSLLFLSFLQLLVGYTSTKPIPLPSSSPSSSLDPVSFVDPRIGTGGEGFGVGSVPIAAQVPFGSMRLGPDTLGLLHSDLEFNHFSGYYYGDHIVRAFSHTRLVGAGVSDYGSIGVMPTRPPVSLASTAPDGARAPFKKSSEAAAPGRYDVWLESIGVNVSLSAAGPFTAMHLYTNTQAQPLSLQFDFAHAAGASTPHHAVTAPAFLRHCLHSNKKSASRCASGISGQRRRQCECLRGFPQRRLAIEAFASWGGRRVLCCKDCGFGS
jgi:hypothetical protein